MFEDQEAKDEQNIPLNGLADALAFVAGQAERAQGAGEKLAIVPCPKDPLDAFLVVNPTGQYEIMEPSPFPRNHKLLHAAEVAGYVERILQDSQIPLSADETIRSPSVWFNSEYVVIVDNDRQESRRLDRATVPLVFTPQYRKLREICGDLVKNQPPVNLRQREFIKLFNRDLRDCLPPDQLQGLLRALRAIDFESTVATSTNIGRGKESMGASIKEEIRSAAGPIPEELVLTLPVFTDSTVNTVYSVRCLVEIDTKQQCFTLEALAGELDLALNEAVEAVGAVLKAALKDSVPVFCGSP